MLSINWKFSVCLPHFLFRATEQRHSWDKQQKIVRTTYFGAKHCVVVGLSLSVVLCFTEFTIITSHHSAAAASKLPHTWCAVKSHDQHLPDMLNMSQEKGFQLRPFLRENSGQESKTIPGISSSKLVFSGYVSRGHQERCNSVVLIWVVMVLYCLSLSRGERKEIHEQWTYFQVTIPEKACFFSNSLESSFNNIHMFKKNWWTAFGNTGRALTSSNLATEKWRSDWRQQFWASKPDGAKEVETPLLRKSSGAGGIGHCPWKIPSWTSRFARLERGEQKELVSRLAKWIFFWKKGKISQKMFQRCVSLERGRGVSYSRVARHVTEIWHFWPVMNSSGLNKFHHHLPPPAITPCWGIVYCYALWFERCAERWDFQGVQGVDPPKLPWMGTVHYPPQN